MLGTRIHLHVRHCGTYLDKLCHEFSRPTTLRRLNLQKDGYALVELGPQEIVHEVARLFLLVHCLVLEDEI